MNRRYLDAHHRRHWARGGETSLENLVLLCSHHHRLLHEGGYVIEDDSTGALRFRNRYGVLVPSIPRSPPGTVDELVERNRNAGLGIGPETNRNGYGEGVELDVAFAAIADAMSEPALASATPRS
jgi:hypothetical protein